jgi:hypothetical protein
VSTLCGLVGITSTQLFEFLMKQEVQPHPLLMIHAGKEKHRQVFMDNLKKN